MRSIGRGQVAARVPEFAFLEAANALLKYVRQGVMPPAEADAHLSILLSAPLEWVDVAPLARQALALAAIRGITAYDAAYLALAIGYDAILVTADRGLAVEAERSALLPEQGPP